MLRYQIAVFLLPVFIFPYVASSQELSERQRGVVERFAQLEQILLRMSEASATSNPRRAELLKKTLLTGKDKLVVLRLEGIVDVLQKRRLTEAVAEQEEVEKDLLELLRMLESENRDQRRSQEKERIKEFLRDLEEIIHEEKALKARTTQEEAGRLSTLEKKQSDIRRQTQSLQEKIAETDHHGQNNPENKSDGEKPETGESDAENPPENSSPAGQATPQPLRKALARMKQAEEKLQKAERDGALEDQEEAIAELQKAKSELEKILRQLREEELLQTLEKLEVRFRRMLRVEESIRTQTASLGASIANSDESQKRQIDIQADRLSADQQAVIDDADAALVLLREDGTARAMVESLLLARFDMDDARRRLDDTKLDSITLGIEDAVIAALQEMLDAIDLAVKEAEKRKETPPPSDGQNGVPGEEPLIRLLSELKMIRSMQERVNERTLRCETEMDALQNEPNVDWNAFRKRVEELARQQSRISRILHDLKVGRTQ